MTERFGNVVGLPSREPFVDRKQLAKELCVSLRTLDRWREEPGFPEEQWGPRTIRFQVGVVHDWLRNRSRRAA